MVNRVRPVLMTRTAPVTMHVNSQRCSVMTVMNLPQTTCKRPSLPSPGAQGQTLPHSPQTLSLWTLCTDPFNQSGIITETLI